MHVAILVAGVFVLPLAALAQTPPQAAAQEMIRVYEEFCLVRFPDPHAVAHGASAHHMTPATEAQSSQALLGRPGQAWQSSTPNGSYVVAIQSGGRQGCAVSGDVADDAGIRAAFLPQLTPMVSGNDFEPRQSERRDMRGHRTPRADDGSRPSLGDLRQADLACAAGAGQKPQAYMVVMADGAEPVLHIQQICLDGWLPRL